jgi:hypothetical protein
LLAGADGLGESGDFSVNAWCSSCWELFLLFLYSLCFLKNKMRREDARGFEDSRGYKEIRGETRKCEKGKEIKIYEKGEEI